MAAARRAENSPKKNFRVWGDLLLTYIEEIDKIAYLGKTA
jgi:hypothetical protein